MQLAGARELFDSRSRAEDTHARGSPYTREEGLSWRCAEEEHCKSQMSSFVSEADDDESQANVAGRGCFVCCCLGIPFLFALTIAWSMSCWMVSLPGIAWVCVPLCLWAAWEIHKLWLYWDGRAEFMEEWPALKLMRTSVIALVFALTLGVNLLIVVLTLWGLRSWYMTSWQQCPF
mmetsp:Transcript_83639/g.132202  ORF Transcript_83639/g.132202 Transcript_83639/m.132202 type:complete len:176 (-) Transcript_83639:50-577(-)